MNCKPGDLAVIVHSVAGNEGKMVTVLRPAIESEVQPWDHRDEGFHWFVKAEGRGIVSTKAIIHVAIALPDCRLRPIRDPGEDATDETLLWTPVPNKQEQPA